MGGAVGWLWGSSLSVRGRTPLTASAKCPSLAPSLRAPPPKCMRSRRVILCCNVQAPRLEHLSLSSPSQAYGIGGLRKRQDAVLLEDRDKPYVCDSECPGARPGAGGVACGWGPESWSRGRCCSDGHPPSQELGRRSERGVQPPHALLCTLKVDGQGSPICVGEGWGGACGGSGSSTGGEKGSKRGPPPPGRAPRGGRRRPGEVSGGKVHTVVPAVTGVCSLPVWGVAPWVATGRGLFWS